MLMLLAVLRRPRMHKVLGVGSIVAPHEGEGAGAPNRVNVAPDPTLSLGCPSRVIPVHGRIPEGF